MTKTSLKRPFSYQRASSIKIVWRGLIAEVHGDAMTVVAVAALFLAAFGMFVWAVGLNSLPL